MEKIAYNVIYDVLHGYKMSFRIKAEIMTKQGNKKRAEIYNAKANTVRECIRLIRKI